MPSSTLAEREKELDSLPVGENRSTATTEAVVDDELTMILVRLHLEVIYKLSR